MKKLALKVLTSCLIMCFMLIIFTACNNAVEFRINFISDGEIYATVSTSGGETIKMPNNPVKEDYTFNGWFWDKDVWEKPFTANSLLDAPLSSDMSVYAKFTKNHEHNYAAILTAPTCTEKGYTTYTCVCGDSYKDDYVNALEHDYIALVTEPTCTEQGYTTHTCSRCGDSYVDSYTDALEHEFTNYVYNNDATYDKDGTKTAVCNRGCGATHTITAENTKLKSEIVFKTLSVNEELNVYGKVANTKATFSFINEVEAKGNATFVVSTDIYGMQQIPTKTVPLEIGDNTFFITEIVGNDIRLFTVTIRRRPVYTVSFNTSGGTKVSERHIEEDDYTEEPTTTKAGYTFAGWDYDFSKPITKNMTIKASWTANTNTPYKVEYYLQNLENDNYTLQDTENLTGTTDTTAVAEIKSYGHFNPTSTSVMGNINADGSTVLKVYYNLEMFSVKISADDDVTIDKTYNGRYKYGYKISEIKATANLGYDVNWYSDEDFLINNYILPAFTVDKNINYVAKATIKEEMQYFNFTSDTKTCIITELKDKGISEIIIPNYVTSIGDKTFNGCYDLKNIYYIGTESEWAQINGIYNIIRLIGQYIQRVMPIDPYNFDYPVHIYVNGNLLWNITNLVLEDITEIKPYAFSLCSSLTNVTIPDSVTSIGDGAFGDCSSLESITIPDGVTSIGDNAFSGCNSLISVSIGNSVTSIAYRAFYGCSSLTSITIPDSVTSIGDYAFRNCSSLTNITIGNGVTSIGSGAFEYCSNLTSITIPDSVTRIGNFAFSSCGSLTDIYYTGTVSEWASKIDGLDKLMKSGRTLYINGEPLKNAVLEGITEIKPSAFDGCSSLTSVTIGNSVTSIGNSAFSACSSLTEVTIPNSVKSIGEWTFYGCSSLTSITIGNSVTSIGDDAFYNCYNLYYIINESDLQLSFDSTDNGYLSYSARIIEDKHGDVKYKNNIPIYIQDKFMFEYIDSQYRLIAYLGNKDTITLPLSYDGHSYTIYCMRGVRNVVIPYGITSIGNYAFSGCSSLTSITIPDSVIHIEDKAFWFCYSLTSITIPNSVTSIGYQAFWYCSSLTSIAIGNSVKIIGEQAFGGCQNLTNIAIPNSVTSIGEWTFRGCSSLTSVTIGNSVTSIGNSAFSACSSLTSVTIGNSVTSIGNSAFSACSSLTSVTIPNSVTSIGSYAFQGCNSLTDITFNGTKEQWRAISKADYWKSGVPSNCIIHCSDGDIGI